MTTTDWRLVRDLAEAIVTWWDLQEEPEEPTPVEDGMRQATAAVQSGNGEWLLTMVEEQIAALERQQYEWENAA